MKTIGWVAGLGLCLAASLAYAQDTGQMAQPSGSQSQGSMSQGSMSQSGGSMSSGSMSHDSMGNKNMSSDSMKKGHMKKKPDNAMQGQPNDNSMNGPNH